MSHSKRGAQATAIGMICVLLGVISFEIDCDVAEQEGSHLLGEGREITIDTLSGDSDLYTGKNDGFRQFRYAGWRYL